MQSQKNRVESSGEKHLKSNSTLCIHMNTSQKSNLMVTISYQENVKIWFVVKSKNHVFHDYKKIAKAKGQSTFEV